MMILESRMTNRKSDFWRGVFIFLELLVVSLFLFSVQLLMAAKNCSGGPFDEGGGGSGVGARGGSVGRDRGGLAASLENFQSGSPRQQRGRDERFSDGDFARSVPDRDDVSRPARDSDGEHFRGGSRRRQGGREERSSDRDFSRSAPDRDDVSRHARPQGGRDERSSDGDFARSAPDRDDISRPARSHRGRDERSSDGDFARRAADGHGGAFSSKGDVLPRPARDSDGDPFATGGDGLGRPARDSGANEFEPREEGRLGGPPGMTDPFDKMDDRNAPRFDQRPGGMTDSFNRMGDRNAPKIDQGFGQTPARDGLPEMTDSFDKFDKMGNQNAPGFDQGFDQTHAKNGLPLMPDWFSETLPDKIDSEESPEFDQRFDQMAEQRFGIVKMREGAGPNAWKAVDWDEPIPAEDELAFGCDWATFTSSSGERANICDGGGPASTGGAGCPNGRHLTDVWYRDLAGGNEPIFVEVGAGHGACVLELLLETSATILAFEPHPKNVYHVRKAMMRLDGSLRDRVMLFPIGLADERQTDAIPYSSKRAAHDGRPRTLAIHAERLDRVLDMNKMTSSTKLVVNMEVQGFECKILEGIGQMLVANIELIKLKWQDDHQECGEYEDYLQMLRRVFGMEIWRQYSEGTFGQFLPSGKRPVFNGVDLFATKN